MEKGKRVVLTIYGRGFTSQIGILVNGVPLRQSLGLAQPFIVDDGKTQEKLDKDLKKEVDGTFERVDSNQLVASFRLDDKFEGIPASIALIAPGKSIELRTLSTQFYVNDNPGWAMADFMFGKRPVDDKGALKVSKVSAYKLNGKLKVIITGDNLDRAKYVWINGEYPQMFRDPKVLNFDPIAPPKEKIIEVILVTDEGASIPAVIDNPFYEVEKTESAFRIDPNELAFGDAKLVKCYEFGAKTKRADFQLGGLGFKPAIELFMGTTKLKSRVLRSNLLEVEIPDPEDEPEIEVRDKVRGLKAIVRVYFSRPSGGCKVLPTTP
ncbi:MAG: hypothetical protein IPJ30_01405 [Acidobacteria bacterium]|nr:hypothetical protein [Acidobacteriota bacterium]